MSASHLALCVALASAALPGLAAAGRPLPSQRLLPTPKRIQCIGQAAATKRAQRVRLDRGAVAHAAAGAGTDEAFILDTTGPTIEIVAASSQGVRHARRTLQQLSDGAELERCRVEDWPTFRVRGLLLDISRGGMLHPDAFERVLRESAELKLNTLVVYSENAIGYPGEPAGPSLSSDTIARMARAAEREGIALVVLQQTIAHMGEVVARAPLWSVPGQSGVLDVRQPPVMGFIAKRIERLIDSTTAAYVHIGGDEVPLDAFGEKGAEHYVRAMNSWAADIVARRRTPVMWADVALRSSSVLNGLTRDAILSHWDYSVRSTYRRELDRLRGQRFRVWAVAGTHAWARPLPARNAAAANILTMARDAESSGAEGLLVAHWNDGGHGFLAAADEARVWAAAAAWEGQRVLAGRAESAIRDRVYQDRDGVLTGALAAIPEGMRLVHMLGGKSSADGALWDVSCDAVSAADGQAPALVELTGRAALASLGAPSTESHLRAVLRHGVLRYLWWAEMARLCIASRAPRVETTDEALRAGIARVRSEGAALRRNYERLWREEYQTAGLERQLARYTNTELRVVRDIERGRSQSTKEPVRLPHGRWLGAALVCSTLAALLATLRRRRSSHHEPG
jgi:hypothetical protein